MHMHGGCLLDFALAGSTKVNFGAVEVAKIHVLANCADGSDVVLKVNIDRNLDGGAFASLLEKVERYPHFRGAHVLALAAAELDSTEKETSAQVKNADQIASSSADAPASVQVVVRAASEEQVPVNMGAFGRMRKPAPA